MARLSHKNHRRGVSILEVLFSILITSIGLLGVIAIFPAAMLQAKRGMQADGVAVAGLRNIHDFDAQGMRNPYRWVQYDGSSFSRMTALPDGSRAYCIDPRFIAANRTDTSANNFPYGGASVMQRVTLDNGVPNGTVEMTALMAELNFVIDDDLAYDRFKDRVRDTNTQAASIFARNGNDALKRQSQGHLSWMATLAPKLERLPLPNGSIEDRYVLSIVVFNDRPTELDASRYPRSDWGLTVSLTGGGVGGGDVRLTETDTSLAAEERIRRLSVRRDQWIMLASYTQLPGVSGQNLPQRICPLCRWYRVIDADDVDTSNYSIDVTLAGADWENTGQTVYAVVAQGAIGVYEKTIKLETGL